MKKSNNKKLLLVYFAVLVVVFYALPWLFRGGVLNILLINPLTLLICSILYSRNNGFTFLTTIITVILFFPSIFIFYNESAWIYTVFYAIISIIGSSIGSAQNKKRA